MQNTKFIRYCVNKIVKYFQDDAWDLLAVSGKQTIKLSIQFRV